MAPRTPCVIVSMLVAAAAAGMSMPRASAAEGVDFSRDVLPILSVRCFECHGPDGDARESDLRLDVREGALAEGSESPAVVPGRPDESAIIARITAHDPDMRMPPADKGPALSVDEVRLIREWIAQGAEYTEHWAFVEATRPPAPTVSRDDWPQSPIDRFVLARLEEEGLQPAESAPRATLIRRATLDVTGLPPTPEEVAAFVDDGAPDAYAKLVDRLLASPHYGERWGRHWLDVARYADSGGFETDIFFGHAWRYRDYVIRSLNADKPFDQFVEEQIAGDEMYPDDAEARTATGFYTIGPVLQEAGMVDGQLEYDLLTDAADATGSAFLGLTIGCARCHDHKYDPVSQHDYYALQAIFAASDQHDFDEAGRLLRSGVALRKTVDEFALEQLRSRARLTPDGPQRDEYLREVGEFYIEQDRELRERLEESENWAAYDRARRRLRRAEERLDLADDADGATAQLDELLGEVGEAALELAGEDRRGRRALRRLSREERDAYYVDYGREHLDLVAPEGLVGDVDALRLAVGRERLDDPSEIPVRALAHREEPLEVRILGRGELSSPGERALPAFPAKLARGPAPSTLPPEKWRTALAGWIASEDNPLTARVIVNRVWQWHFGAGLVRTPNDFGSRGERPTHPELLDWLAVEFVEHGWSLKHLHRTIMLSSTYQMSAAADGMTLALDPENRLLARYQPHRMEAEVLWDSVRAVSGDLNLAMYGLPVAPPLDQQEEIGNYKDWPTSAPEELDRRGVYLLTRRSFRFPMLGSFDLPDNAASCGRRDVTTIPNQCLALLNNRTMQEQAAAFAARLLRETDGGLTDVAPLAWRYAYGREMTDEEERRVMGFLSTRRAELSGDPQDATATAVGELCLAIFNTNEFIFIPQLAAMACQHTNAANGGLSRRHWITQVGCGMGAWALLDLLARDGRADALDAAGAAEGAANPLAARPPHFAARAKSVIFLMMAGGPSQMETFDPKPTLNELSGQRMPASFGTIPAQFTDVTKQPLLGYKLGFRRCGQSGIPISEALPHLQQHADKLAVIRSCYHEAFNHSPAQYVLTTGQSRLGLPSVGAWITYGLGTVSDNLPAMVVMTEPDGKVKGGTPCWGNGFLPAIYQGAPLQTEGTPILYLDRQPGVTLDSQRRVLDLSRWLNERHSAATPAAAAELDSRIAAYELAFRMQTSAPEAVDLSRETAATRTLYGLDDDRTRDFGTRCLLARRLVERGVRFVQLISGSGDSKDWDHHDDSHAGTLRQTAKVDQPIAGLLQDLDDRGLLDETLVVWSGEFGRTPTSQSSRGRDHNPNGFTMWMAGGGIVGGKIIGATDEIGLRAVEDRVHMHDAHATILSLLGLDHRRLTYLHQGRQQRLTDVGGDNDLASRLIEA